MRRGSGGARWAFLLLAGVLLTAAATAGGARVAPDGDHKDNDKEALRFCKKVCEWKYGHDASRVWECKSECRKKHPQEDMNVALITKVDPVQCDAMCMAMHAKDPWEIPVCVYHCYADGQAAAAADGDINDDVSRSVGDWIGLQRPVRAQTHGKSVEGP